tara:strand:+ start:23615 stop:25483 length:1869 start_codon:yes stop_codon:yes gene_type:complete
VKRSSVAAPANLQRARATLESVSSVKNVGQWQYYHPNNWAIDLSVCLARDGNQFLPNESRWYVVVSALYPEGPIEIYPAKKGGIACTFWHQNFNGAGDGKDWGAFEWRTGKLCLDHPFNSFTDFEPVGVEERLAWHLDRTVQWCEHALDETLVEPDHPFELPQYPHTSDAPGAVAFSEDAISYAEWQDIGAREGFVQLKWVSTTPSFFVTCEFQDARKAPVKSLSWGAGLQKLFSDKDSIGLWVLLEAIPVDPPWAFPNTWGDLYSQCLSGRTDLKQLLDQHSKSIRDGKEHFVLVGYPVPEKFGDEPSRINWSALMLPPLTDKKRSGTNKYARKDRAGGFRKNEEGFIKADNMWIRHATMPVPWCPTFNWAPDQLGTRGSLDPVAQEQRVLLIGAGALGSLFAENWVRAGGVVTLILDVDQLLAGNLARHTLSLVDVGQNKAVSLACRLNMLNPHLNCEGSRKNLLSHTHEEFKKLTEAIDVIVDCTGADDVLAFLKGDRAERQLQYVSLSTGYEAERLYAFSSHEIAFPLDKFRELYGEWKHLDREAIQANGLPWEGVGCWHPLVPARIDSLSVLAGQAVRFMERAILDRPEKRFEVWLSSGVLAENTANTRNKSAAGQS